jgi:hypothetical protein
LLIIPSHSPVIAGPSAFCAAAIIGVIAAASKTIFKPSHPHLVFIEHLLAVFLLV